MSKEYFYPELDLVEKNGKRYYLDSNNYPVPSVTTILSLTSNKSGVDEWRRRVGSKKADEIVHESTVIGSAVHEAIENYLSDQKWDSFDRDRLGLISKSITNKFIETGLTDITQIWGLESGLILDGLYAGTADCIGIYKDKPAIIDFKTARKIKKKEWIEDYFLQCCAYANAHNVMFDTNIKDLIILMVDRDLMFKEFHITEHEFPFYTDKWKKRLIKYHNNY